MMLSAAMMQVRHEVHVRGAHVRRQAGRAWIQHDDGTTTRIHRRTFDSLVDQGLLRVVAWPDGVAVYRWNEDAYEPGRRPRSLRPSPSAIAEARLLFLFDRDPGPHKTSEVRVLWPHKVSPERATGRMWQTLRHLERLGLVEGDRTKAQTSGVEWRRVDP